MNTPKLIHRVKQVLQERGEMVMADLMRAVGKQPADGSAYLSTHIKSGALVSYKKDGIRYIRLPHQQPAYSEPEQTDTCPNVTHTPIDVAINALADALTTKIASMIDARVTSMIDEKVTAKVAENLTQLAAQISKEPVLVVTSVPAEQEPAHPPASHKPKLPAILVGGLINSQHDVIRREFSSKFDVRFVSTDEHPHQWGAKAHNVAHVFMLRDFISHKHSSVVSSAIDKSRISLVPGSITALKEEIHTYYDLIRSDT